MISVTHRQRGFTLIEILIALFIFAILGTIAAVGLRSVINAYHGIQRTDQTLRKMQFAFLLIRRDFTQLIQRPITGVSGEELPALIINSTDHLEFTTGGFVNPYDLNARSTLIRVAYALENQDLVRITWPVLDRPPQVDTQRRVLLHHVTKMHFDYVNSHGQLTNVWPTTSSSPLPQAIIMTMTIDHFGQWRGVFPLMGRGTNDN